jgi:hypothetical protein
LTVAGTSNIDAGAAPITLTSIGNHFTGTLTLKGTVTKVTDSGALDVKLDHTGDTYLIANAGGGAGDLKISGATDGNLIAVTNGGVLVWNSLSAANAYLIAASPAIVGKTPQQSLEGISPPSSSVLAPNIQYNNPADATGTNLVVGGELVLIANNLPRTGSGDVPSMKADTAILKIASLQPGSRVTIVLNGVLELLVDHGEFRFSGTSELPSGVATLDPDQVLVCIGTHCISSTLAQRAQEGARSAAQQSAVSSASADARQSFGTDSVTQQIDMGFSGDVGIAPTMGHTVPLEGEIISTPPCVPEARAGQDCK